MTLSKFEELGLAPNLIEAVARLEYQEPTPIQAGIIPLMLAGKDVIGQAQTGTGKTAAFALPILQSLEAVARVQALVVTPTRELALQVNEAFEALGGDVPTVTIYGGQPYPVQVKALKRGARVVVGTPGRLLDLLQQQVLRLEGVRTVVLDEADEMLSMGFLDEVETILAALPQDRQTALFSATLPDEIRGLAGRYLRQPASVSITPSQPAVAAIEQRCYVVNEQDKVAALTRIFEVEDITSALIFARTRARTATLANELMSRGYPAEVLNGDLSQEAREQVLERFKAEKIKVLVATDIAARGLDIDHLTHVFNFDLPQQPESYVHRIGRTGRAGRTGIAIALLTPREERLLRRIESYTKQKAQRCEVPSRDEIMAHRDRQVMEGVTMWVRRARFRRELEMVDELLAEGFELKAIAAAALKLSRAREKQRPIAAISEVKMPEPRRSSRHLRTHTKKSHEAGMVRLKLNVGKNDGLRPGEVVATLAKQARIPGPTVGAIQIKQRYTLVDVPEQFVGKVLARSGRCMMRNRDLEIELA